MRVRLAYDRTGLEVELPSERVVACLSHRAARPLDDPSATLAHRLAHPTGTPPLSELARGRRSACILICDITRPVPNRLLLDPILRTLESSGIPRGKILILVATGLHRPNTREELMEMCGPEVVERYRVENHDGQDRKAHRYLGESPRGVPIWMDARYVDADLKLATGLIEPHMMAGFSGGRKLICPGIAGLETVRAWHGPAFLEHPRADCGMLDGNPVHEENTWIARHVGCDMIVNVVIDGERRPVKLVAGDLVEAFEEGVAFVRRLVTDTVPEPVDIVVTSSAGYPLDTTFYQSVKGMTGALPVVKQGGTIIVAAGLSEGIGSPPFRELLRTHHDLDAFMKAIHEPGYFVMDQWQLEELAKVRRKARVKLVSDGLPAQTIDGLFVESAPSIEEAVDASLADYGDDARIAVIPEGPYVLATLAGDGCAPAV